MERGPRLGVLQEIAQNGNDVEVVPQTSGLKMISIHGRTCPMHWSLWSILFLLLASNLHGADSLSYRNPVMAGDYPDPSVIRIGKDYWATATTSEWAPLFPILHSTDLVNWKIEGAVFQQRPAWSAGNYWAPEISYYSNRSFVYYVGRKKNGPLAVAVATAESPLGPYTDHGPIIAQEAGSIDPVPVLDENGQRYLIWKEDGNSRGRTTPLWCQKLSPDGTRLIGEMKELFHNDAPWEGNVVEGPFVLKHDGWFYLFYSGNACCGRGCHYGLGVARARALLGPWEKNPANPILIGNGDWKCPGHGSIVSDEKGNDFLLYHAYPAADFVYVGREALLEQIHWPGSGWPVINDGKGPSSQAPCPAGIPARHLEDSFYDDFSGKELKPEWQWPQGHQPEITVGGGRLILRGPESDTNNLSSTALAVRSTRGNYTATTIVDSSVLGDATAGLAAYGDKENALGLSIHGQEVRLWRRHRGREEILASSKYDQTASCGLRMTAREGHRFEFAINVDGKAWRELRDNVTLEGEFLPPWDRGVRVALISDGLPASFTSFRVDPQ